MSNIINSNREAAWAVVVVEAEKLALREVSLGISAGIAEANEHAPVPPTVPDDPKLGAVAALWSQFTANLGHLWEQTQADAESYGGSKGLRERLHLTTEARRKINALLTETMPAPAFASGVDDALSVYQRALYASHLRGVMTPELIDALKTIIRSEASLLVEQRAAIEGVLRGGACMSPTLLDPHGLPPLGERTLPEYLRHLADLLDVGQGGRFLSHGKEGLQEQKSLASELRSLADARDPKSKKFTPSVLGGFSHFTLYREGPLAKWMGALSAGELTLDSLRYHQDQPWALLDR
ncbi:MAG: hypothetical protein IT384_32470 [Deltaproteobacteria bacterium]|nr:hypothetical protein [Deltaproteobacteria bacterium]